MKSNSYTQDEKNEFHPSEIKCNDEFLKYKEKAKKDKGKKGHKYIYNHRFDNEGPYNDIDVIRAEMGQLREWKIDGILPDNEKSEQTNKQKSDEKINPKHVDFADFLEEDTKLENDEDTKLGNIEKLKRRKIFEEALFNEKLSALCLSGGGIRSASFCLGVLQALAKNKMLSGFDYLSTVSGGGYIGGWLSAWASREVPDDTQVPQTSPHMEDECIGIKAVEDALWPNSTSSSNNEFNEIFSNRECNEITQLRKYTNFLSPRIGFMSLDTRVFWITYLRNLFLNSLLFVPALLAVITIIKILGMLIPFFADFSIFKYPYSNYFQFKWFMVFAIPYLICHVFISDKMLKSRPRTSSQKLRGNQQAEPTCVKSIIKKLIALTAYWALDSKYEVEIVSGVYYAVIGILISGVLTSPIFHQILTYEITVLWIIPFVVFWGAIWVVTFLIACYVQDESIIKNDDSAKEKDKSEYSYTLYLVIFVSGLFAGAIILLGFYVLNGFLQGFISLNNSSDLSLNDYFSNQNNTHFKNYRLAIYFGPVIPIAADFVGSAIFSALISKQPNMDDLQEWSARMLAWLFMLGGCWLLFSLIAIPPDWSYVPFISDIIKLFDTFLFDKLITTEYPKLYPFTIIIVSGFFVVIYGKSSKTSASPQANEDRNSKLWKSLALLSGIFFLFMIMLNLSSAIDRVVCLSNEFSRFILKLPSFLQHIEAIKLIFECFIHPTPIGYVLLVLCILFVFLAFYIFLTSRLININSFSMHRYYRNRLIRSFLGSVNSKRSPDKFTDFDPSDNMDMSKLTHNSPLLIINTALNLLNDENLSWQERKSSSFTISRLFCGNKDTGYRPAGPSKTNNTESGYGKNISLGTAMAISGAAVSPNMGYNSSPVITFVMTLFNARLGWWLGNPKHDCWRDIGPRFAINYYIYELFGRTNDHSKYVYLSDGGHFENLGAYEMIRRCCRTIVIVDAGCDPDSKFEDLGKIIRLARIDFNVEITFNREFKLTDGEIQHFAPTHPLEYKCPPYCLVGEIEYRNIESRGTIIYIKPGVHGDEPQDVRSYHAQHPVFPHESTSDQFFSESQFESYRKLGLHIGCKVFKAIAI